MAELGFSMIGGATRPTLNPLLLETLPRGSRGDIGPDATCRGPRQPFAVIPRSLWRPDTSDVWEAFALVYGEVVLSASLSMP